jgi:protein TonB
VQGVIVLEAVITREGNVDSVRVVSGHPLLVQAAVDAVRQWRYRPTLLNGQPVEVITTVTVNFTLQ